MKNKTSNIESIIDEDDWDYLCSNLEILQKPKERKLLKGWIEKVIKEETDKAYKKGYADCGISLLKSIGHDYSDIEDLKGVITSTKVEGNLVDRVSKEEPRHLQFNPYEDKSEFADWK